MLPLADMMLTPLELQPLEFQPLDLIVLRRDLNLVVN